MVIDHVDLFFFFSKKLFSYFTRPSFELFPLSLFLLIRFDHSRWHVPLFFWLVRREGLLGSENLYLPRSLSFDPLKNPLRKGHNLSKEAGFILFHPSVSSERFIILPWPFFFK